MIDTYTTILKWIEYGVRNISGFFQRSYSISSRMAVGVDVDTYLSRLICVDMGIGIDVNMGVCLWRL